MRVDSCLRITFMTQNLPFKLKRRVLFFDLLVNYLSSNNIMIDCLTMIEAMIVFLILTKYRIIVTV